MSTRAQLLASVAASFPNNNSELITPEILRDQQNSLINSVWVPSTDGTPLVNPLTTLGDLIYGGVAGATTRLAGYTTSGMAVLTQTGTGAASAAPVWTATIGSGNIVRATSPTLVTPVLGVASATSLAVTGTAGGGFVSLLTQASSPAAPASGFAVFADSTGRFSWRRQSDGFVRTWDAALSANRVYTLPDAASSIPVYGFTITYAGPTQARTVTYPDANFTAARTDAAQSFAGIQSFTNNTAASSTGTGAVVVTGGIGADARSWFNGITLTGNDFITVGKDFYASTATAGVVFSGGNSTTNGGNILVYGGSHATFPGAGRLRSGSSDILQWNSTGVSVLGTLTVSGTVIHTLSATPASAAAAGVVGTISWDASFIYIATGTNQWKRVAIATW